MAQHSAYHRSESHEHYAFPPWRKQYKNIRTRLEKKVDTMKSNETRRHKRSRSSSNSPVYSISDDDSPVRKFQKTKKHSENRHWHKKHLKHHRNRNLESLSDEETNSKLRYREEEVKVKEEPLSEDERERKYKNKHSYQPRKGDERKNFRYHRDETRQKYEQSDSRSKSRAPVQEQTQSDMEPEWGNKEIKTEKKESQKNNAKPDFGLSGKLTEDANTFNGVVIKYSEPPEARKPKRRWRLYPFKGENSLPVLHIHRQSAYLMGRDRKVADIPIDHPSCSKQHAALQYRLVPFQRPDGTKGRMIKLYIIDLESANGTYLNNKKIDPKKYHELKERDVVKFGFSSREYVLLHEHSKDSENDDDVNDD